MNDDEMERQRGEEYLRRLIDACGPNHVRDHIEGVFAVLRGEYPSGVMG